jgi:uncharacterized membrane protein
MAKEEINLSIGKKLSLVLIIIAILIGVFIFFTQFQSLGGTGDKTIYVILFFGLIVLVYALYMLLKGVTLSIGGSFDIDKK